MTYSVVIGGYAISILPESLVWHGPNDIVEERLSGRGTFQLYFGGQMADVVTFDGWINQTDLKNLMAIRDKKRIITFRADLLLNYFTSGSLFMFLEDVIINEQRGFTKNFPYKFRLRKVADGDNYTRDIVMQVTNENTTFANSPKPVLTYPILDGAVTYNGSSQYSINTSITSALNLSTGITIDAVINPTSLPGTMTIIEKGDINANNINFGLFVNSSGAVGFTYQASGPVTHTYQTGNNAITAGVTNYIKVSYTFGTGSGIVIYVNTIAQSGSWVSGTGNSAPLTSSSKLTVGAQINGAGFNQYFTGWISNVSVRNTADALAECLLSYYRGTALIDTNTVGFWQLSEWVGSVNYDSSQNNNKLTMTGTPTFVKGQLNIKPSQLPSSVRNGEYGGIPILDNPNGNTVSIHTLDYDLDFNNVVTGQSGGEMWMKNGVFKMQTRLTQGSNFGAIDVYYWNGTSYAYLGYFSHGIYSSQFYDTKTAIATPSFIVSDDTEYGNLQVVWNGFSDGTAVLAEYEIYKGKPFVSCKITNVGLPAVNSVSTVVSNTQLTNLVNLTQNSVTMTPGGAGIPQSLITASGISLSGSAATANTGSAAAANLSATLTNSANVLIIAAVAIRNATSQTVSSITHDPLGLNMSFSKLVTLTNSTEEQLEYWYLWQPNALTSKPVKVVFSASAEASMVVASFLGTNAALNNAVTAVGTTAAANVTLTANKPIATQITLPVSQTITSLGIHWNTVVAGNVIVSLYSDNGSNVPGTLLTQSVSTAQTAAGWQDVAVGSYYAVAGTYWIAVNSSTGSKIDQLASAGRQNLYDNALGSLIFDSVWNASSTSTGSTNTLELRGWQTSTSEVIFETNNEPTQTSTTTITAISVTINPYSMVSGRWVLLAVAAKGVGSGTPTVADGASQTNIGTTDGTDGTFANNVRIDLSYQKTDPLTALTATLSVASTAAAMCIAIIPQALMEAQYDTLNYVYAATGALAAGVTEVYVMTKTKANDRKYVATVDAGNAYWAAIGQLFSINSSNVNQGFDCEKFYVGVRLTEGGAASDDDPAQLGLECLSVVDQTSDLTKIT